MFYGQKETDKVIASYFPKDYIGKCIEVGVADGVKGSNTKYFEDIGWECLCIDPIPEHVKAAKKVRKNVLQYACGKKEEIKPFFVVNLGKDNIMSSLSSLTIDNRLLVSHGSLINKVTQINVHVKKLDDIINKFYRNDEKWPKHDFISIDTEGTELDVLRGIDLECKYICPTLLVVENNFEDIEIENYLKDFRYKKVERYFVNDFYIKD